MKPLRHAVRFKYARRWVIQAGKKLLRYYRTSETGPIHYKAPSGSEDPVTKVDLLIETYLARRLLRLDPDNQVLTEESGLLGPPRSKGRWIIDPLDGTVNFIHGNPHFAIALAFEWKEKLVFGIVYNPARDEFFHAIRGKGAYLNGEPIRVSTTRTLNEALISTGFNINLMENVDQPLKLFKALLLTTMGLRRTGSAALDICYVAAGRFDAFYEEALSPWDIAAGAIILEEAGGQWTDFNGQKTTIYEREFLGSNGLIHNQMIEVFRWALGQNPPDA